MSVIHVIDDDPTFATYVVAIASRIPEVVTERWSRVQEFLPRFDPKRPAVIVLDHLLPDCTGAEFVERYVPDPVDVPILMITAAPSIELAVDAAHRGVIDVLAKPCSPAALEESLRRLLALEVADRDRRTELRAYRDGLASLTSREREVLDLLVEGRTNKEAAWELGISFRTVEIHRSNLLAKLGARSVVQVANATGRTAARWGVRREPEGD